MPNWEYKVTRVETTGNLNPNLDNLKESDLNEIGRDGWELVDVAVLNSKGSKSFAAYFFFKREVKEVN